MRTILLDIPQNVKDFIAMPDGIYKNICFKNFKGNSWNECNVVEKEGKLFYSSCNITIRCNKGKYWLSPKDKKGFTFDGKKVNVWFGGSVDKLEYFHLLFTHLKKEWVNKDYLYTYITKSSLEKILKGAITNPIDLLKHFLKYTRIKASPQILYNVIKDKLIFKQRFLRAAYTAKNVNHLLEAHLNNIPFAEHILSDCIEQCHILGKQIDFKWSAKRLQEEHTKWTKEIMSYEIKAMEDEIIPNHHLIINIPAEFELLSTKKRIFEEGKIMNHCLYTNYYNSIKNNAYLAFHVSFQGEEATLGIRWNTDNILFDQLYTYYNKSVSPEMKQFCMEFCVQNKESFKKEQKSFETAQNLEELVYQY